MKVWCLSGSKDPLFLSLSLYSPRTHTHTLTQSTQTGSADTSIMIMWISINVTLQHGWLSTSLCMCVCVCPRQQERRGSYCISFNTGYSPRETPRPLWTNTRGEEKRDGQRDARSAEVGVRRQKAGKRDKSEGKQRHAVLF